MGDLNERTLIEVAMAEADRFRRRAAACAKALDAEGKKSVGERRLSLPERAAMRRASLDLAKALAPLRRPA